MKKILLVDASPRKGGNSDVVIETLAQDLQGCEVTVFKMREKDCRQCMACDACQHKDTQSCVQNDDITALLPLIDTCDAIVLATPIYNQQITSRAKLFIERFYPFFRAGDPMMTNSSKRDKKAALVCSFWGSPKDVTTRYAEWTVQNFAQIGANQTRTLIFNGIPERGQILERPDYLDELHALANWLAE